MELAPFAATPPEKPQLATREISQMELAPFRPAGLSDKMCAFSAKDSRHCLGIRRDNAR